MKATLEQIQTFAVIFLSAMIWLWQLQSLFSRMGLRHPEGFLPSPTMILCVVLPVSFAVLTILLDQTQVCQCQFLYFVLFTNYAISVSRVPH